MESSSDMLTGIVPDMILKSAEIVLHKKQEWQPPVEYLDTNVSSKIVKNILGYH